VYHVVTSLLSIAVLMTIAVLMIAVLMNASHTVHTRQPGRGF